MTDNHIKIYAAYPWSCKDDESNNGVRKKNEYSPLAIKDLINRIDSRLKSIQQSHPEMVCPKIFYSRLRPTSGSFILSSIRERMSSAYAIIFDITGYNPNVMFELGVALEQQQHLSTSAKVFLIMHAKEYSSSLLPSDLGGYFLTTYWIDDNSKAVTFADNGSLVMRILSDVLEQKHVTFIEGTEQNLN